MKLRIILNAALGTMLPPSPAPAPPVHHQPVIAAPAPRKVWKAARSTPPSQPATEPPLNAACRSKVLDILRRGAYSSGKLIERTRCKPAAVYNVLTALRKLGIVETRDADGLKKNFLVDQFSKEPKCRH